MPPRKRLAILHGPDILTAMHRLQMAVLWLCPCALMAADRPNVLFLAVDDLNRLVEWKVPGAAAETADLELYDDETDPLETKNLATARPEVVSHHPTPPRLRHFRNLGATKRC